MKRRNIYRGSEYKDLTQAGKRDHNSMEQITMFLRLRTTRLIQAAEQAFPLATGEISELLYKPEIWEATQRYVAVMEEAYPNADVAVGVERSTLMLRRQGNTPVERHALVELQCLNVIRVPYNQDLYDLRTRNTDAENTGAFDLYFRDPAKKAAFGRWVDGAIQARRRAEFIHRAHKIVMSDYNTPASLQKIWPEIVPHGTAMGRCGKLTPLTTYMRQQVDGANAMLALEALLPRDLVSTAATVKSWSKFANDIV